MGGPSTALIEMENDDVLLSAVSVLAAPVPSQAALSLAMLSMLLLAAGGGDGGGDGGWWMVMEVVDGDGGDGSECEVV